MAWIGFNSATQGLLTSQKQLYITNHNINNQATDGYSRQIGKQRAASPMDLPGIGMLGNGTEMYEISRQRDSYANKKYWNENKYMGEWELKENNLLEIQRIINEPSDSSVRKNLDEIFKAFEELSKRPSDSSTRALVRQKALTFTKHLNETSTRLYNLQSDINFQVSEKINNVNEYAGQISKLNKEIMQLEIDGSTANDLRDSRDLLIDKLSKIVNINVDENKGKMRISVGGIGLVDHDETHLLKYPPTQIANPLNPKEKLNVVEWSLGEESVALKSGELKSLLDLRDLSNLEYRGIPYYIKKLDQFANVFAEKMNEVHSSGFALDMKTVNIKLFTVDGQSTEDQNQNKKKITALNIGISADIMDNLDNIAAADADNGADNNKNALKLIALREDPSFFESGTGKGTPDDFVKSILSTIAVDGNHATTMFANQKTVFQGVKMRRESVSGVNSNEELSNMVQFLKSYRSNAKMLTTFDKVFEVTINQLGLVGR